MSVFYFVLLCVIATVASAEEVVKVTYALDGMGTQGASAALEFSQYAMVVAERGGDFNDIQRVEYYDDQSVILNKGGGKPIAVREGFIGFDASGGDLNLTLPQALELSVSLCTPDGKSVALLYCGEYAGETLPLRIKDHGLASGSYSLVVSTSNALFVRSLDLH